MCISPLNVAYRTERNRNRQHTICVALISDRMEITMKKTGLLNKMISSIMTFALISSAIPAGMALQKSTAKADSATEIVYHAALGIQTAGNDKKESKDNSWVWMKRFGYYGKIDMGKKKTEQNISGYGTDNFSKLLSVDKDDKITTHAGTFTDTQIKDNGEYTVSLDGADFEGVNVVSQLHIATDIPTSSKIDISNIRVNVNGTEILKMDKGVLDSDTTYLEFGKVFLAINHWRDEINTIDNKAGLKTSPNNENGYVLLNGGKDEKISITFTVSGFDKAAEQKVQQKEQERKAALALVGTTKKIGGFTYKITNATASSEAVTLIKDNQNKKSRTIPATVKIDKRSYKVTAIGNSAFAKNKKLQKIVIGKNIKSIGKKAFFNCKKLKTIDVRKCTSIKKVGKNIVKSTKCKFLVPKSKKKAYQKLCKKLTLK